MIGILTNPADQKQIQEMSEEFSDYVKVVVDLEREILAGGGRLHVDCEQELLKKGSRQEDLWGGGTDLANKAVEFNSLTNIKPGQNPSQEILDVGTRQKFEEIVRRLIPMGG
jgi:hypothetical protein